MSMVLRLAARRMLNLSSISGLKQASSSSSSSSSSQSEVSSLETVHLSENCIRRMKELHTIEPEKKLLRLGVETGGCSGYMYEFKLDNRTNSDDRVFEKNGVKLIVDNVSYGYVKGSTVDYVEELICSAFKVAVNPAAVVECSCKSSFMVKQ